MKFRLQFLNCFIFLVSTIAFSQGIKTTDVPNSIYSFSYLSKNTSNAELNSYALFSSKYQFLLLDSKSFRNSQLSINTKAFKIKPTYFFEEFIISEHEKNILQRSFFKINDLYELPRDNKRL
jgi:hypothetical protein